MKTKILSFFFICALLVPTSAFAIETYPIPAEKRIQITNYTDNNLHQLKTSGQLIHWWNSTRQQLFVYGIEANELAVVEQGALIFDLQLFGDRFVLTEADRSEYFVYGNFALDSREEIRPGRFVDGIYCFDGSKVGYISEQALYVYDVETGSDILISENVNGSFFFCSISQGYISFNDVTTGNSRVRLRKLSDPSSIELSQTSNEGRSSVVLGDTVYFVEGPMIYSYNIATSERKTLYQGEEVGGYVDQLGVHYLTFHSREENTLVHPYLAFPNQNNLIYRFGDIDFWQSGGHMYNGIYTWFQLNNGQIAVYATNFLTLDSDADLVRDIDEIFGYSTDPFNPDSDGDGYNDGVEIENGFSPTVPANQEPAPAEEPVEQPETDLGTLGTQHPIFDSIAGRILLQVESNGEAWYADPVTRKRYYMKDGPTAYQMLRTFGLGITNADLVKIPVEGQPLPEHRDFVRSLAGRILLQVEKNGEAWYIDPVSLRRVYLKDGEAAYNLMRELGLGITNKDLGWIIVGHINE